MHSSRSVISQSGQEWACRGPRRDGESTPSNRKSVHRKELPSSHINGLTCRIIQETNAVVTSTWTYCRFIGWSAGRLRKQDRASRRVWPAHPSCLFAIVPVVPFGRICHFRGIGGEPVLFVPVEISHDLRGVIGAAQVHVGELLAHGPQHFACKL